MNPPEDLTLTHYPSSQLKRHLAKAEAHIKAANALIDGTTDFAAEAPFDALAHTKRLRRGIARLERVITDAAIAQMHHLGQAYHVGSGYTAVLRPAEERKGWQNDAIMADLIDATVERMMSRHPFMPRKAVTAIVTEAMWTMHKAGRIDWRSTSLRSLGLDPDDYSHYAPTSPSLDMRGTATHAPTRPRRKKLP